MSKQPLAELTGHLDRLLRVAETPDYPPALNGLQLANSGTVRRVAAAVDASLRTIDGAIAAGADLLLVHHGLFWAGAQRVDGVQYQRLHRLFTHDVAVYSAHLPLDVHPVHGNSRLLAIELGLVPTDGFAMFEGVFCGVRGESTVRTNALHDRLRTFARSHGGDAIATPFPPERETRRWAICSGAGASRETLHEAAAFGVDTLIVGEGPHWTAVDAIDAGLVVMYAGHYATETLGVCSLAAHIEREFGVPWAFIAAPTGL
ncbi:MAG TPA: Nif3-like dinuclear metal center hexameric protein [Gemmatimonadaceae bacterium]|nr:Nif3-like dinuclear metal center hexameric protein [Gemmatimonadaceae bacterium]